MNKRDGWVGAPLRPYPLYCNNSVELKMEAEAVTLLPSFPLF